MSLPDSQRVGRRRCKDRTVSRPFDSHRPLFEIGVYRLSKACWLAERRDRRAREEAAAEARWHLSPDEARHCVDASEKYWGWEYNEIAAWLRLMWDGPGPMIKAYLWAVGVDARRPRKRLSWRSTRYPFLPGDPAHKVFEVPFAPASTDSEIYERLHTELERCDTELQFGGHVDLDAFRTTGPHVRWRAAIGLRG